MLVATAVGAAVARTVGVGSSPPQAVDNATNATTASNAVVLKRHDAKRDLTHNDIVCLNLSFYLFMKPIQKLVGLTRMIQPAMAQSR